MASNLAPLVNLVQGYIELGAKMLAFSSSFLQVLQLWVAVVMVIVALSRQSINCTSCVVVCRCMEVRGTFVLYFHVGGLIVSCGFFWWFGGSNLSVGCK